jgi:hypothetical protein
LLATLQNVINSRNEFYRCVPMMWRAISARLYSKGGDRGILSGSSMRQCDGTPFPASLAVGSSLCVLQARPAMYCCPLAT